MFFGIIIVIIIIIFIMCYFFEDRFQIHIHQSN